VTQPTKVKKDTGNMEDKDLLESTKLLYGLTLGATVCFAPSEIKVGSTHTRFCGEVWIPGYRPQHAVWYVKGLSMELRHELGKALVLEATIKEIKKDRIYLSDVELSNKHRFKDFAGNDIADIEVAHVDGRISCHACDTVMHDYTKEMLEGSIMFRGDTYAPEPACNTFAKGEYMFLCPDCVDDFCTGEMKDESSDKYKIVSEAIQGRKYQREAA
jgi:hypothetical protein